jgi:hypothetical protein
VDDAVREEWLIDELFLRGFLLEAGNSLGQIPEGKRSVDRYLFFARRLPELQKREEMP